MRVGRVGVLSHAALLPPRWLEYLLLQRVLLCILCACACEGGGSVRDGALRGQVKVGEVEKEG